jgi:rare lipoprotein A (peptidoglycan hydrolase)
LITVEFQDLTNERSTSGEPYDKNGLTAAHKKLAYGTKVKVTNVANGAPPRSSPS